MAQFLWYDCTFKNICTVPVTLTYEGQLFLVNWLSAYKCPAYILDRYLNRNMSIPVVLLHVKRNTRQKWR